MRLRVAAGGGALAALSLPIILTNLGQVAIQTTDVVMIGWLGPEALAASVLGVNVNFVLLLFAIGVVIATAPMMAQDLWPPAPTRCASPGAPSGRASGSRWRSACPLGCCSGTSPRSCTSCTRTRP